MQEEKTVNRGEYGLQPFNIIHNSDILAKSDFDKLLPLTEELQDTFKKSQVFRTRTEMEISVLNDLKHPTHASKYWQAVREQNVMFTETVMLSYEYRKNLIEIKKLQREMEEEEDELEKELKQIEIEKKQFISKNHEKTAKDRIRELAEWSDIKKRESQAMSEEDLADVNNHQLRSYTQRFLNQSAAAGDSGSPSEKQNLKGQLQAGLKECKKRGLDVGQLMKGEENLKLKD